jgi:predicted RNase H-like nuclease (RuvC/YqgF family)
MISMMLILVPLILLGQNISNNCIDPTYPVTKVINGDTVVLFTLRQEKCIYQHLSIKEALEEELYFSDQMGSFMGEYIDSLESRLDHARLEISLLDTTLQQKNKKIQALNDKLVIGAKQYNLLEAERNKYRKQRNWALGGAGALLIILFSIAVSR